MRTLYKKYFIWVVIATILIVPIIVDAQTFNITNGLIGNLTSSDCKNFGNCGFCDWIELFTILQKVILSLFGGLALVMMLWAAFGWVGSAGSQEKIQASKKLIISTIFGILIVLVGFFLVKVTILALVSPPGQAPVTTLFGSDWSTAYCKKPTTLSAICERAGEGGTCNYTAKVPDGTCQRVDDGTGQKHWECVQCKSLADGTKCGNEAGYTCRKQTMLNTYASPPENQEFNTCAKVCDVANCDTQENCSNQNKSIDLTQYCTDSNKACCP